MHIQTPPHSSPRRPLSPSSSPRCRYPLAPHRHLPSSPPASAALPAATAPCSPPPSPPLLPHAAPAGSRSGARGQRRTLPPPSSAPEAGAPPRRPSSAGPHPGTPQPGPRRRRPESSAPPRAWTPLQPGAPVLGRARSPALMQPLRPGTASRQGHGGASPWAGPGWWRGGERGHFSPAGYFVEEVITGYDETDLYKTWLRANAMRSPEEKNTLPENMTWRIWNLARKKKPFRSWIYPSGTFILFIAAQLLAYFQLYQGLEVLAEFEKLVNSRLSTPVSFGE